MSWITVQEISKKPFKSEEDFFTEEQINDCIEAQANEGYQVDVDCVELEEGADEGIDHTEGYTAEEIIGDAEYFFDKDRKILISRLRKGIYYLGRIFSGHV